MTIIYGAVDDLPVVGDWNGNGIDTVGVYRPSTNIFYLTNQEASLTTPAPAHIVRQFGAPKDLPITGDWDGDGFDSVGVYRAQAGYFHFRLYSEDDKILSVHYGMNGDKPVVGDWDGQRSLTRRQKWCYAYDNLNRLSNAVRVEQELQFAGWDTATPSNNEIIQKWKHIQSYTYTYDQRSNRTGAVAQNTTYINGAIDSTNSVATDYLYNTANQLSYITQNGVTQPLSYDLNGNLLGNGYTYDAANRLTATNGGVSYSYDGMGNRLSMTANGQTTAYLLDLTAGLSQILRETTGSSVTHSLYGLDLVGQATGTNWTFFTYDGLGSVRATTDKAGKFLNNQDYDPYGSPEWAITGPGYTGEFTDPNGLLNLRARLYDPIRGIFLTRDPVEGTPDRVGSRNGYGYVEGNPVNRTDPSGECWNYDDRSEAQSITCQTAWATLIADKPNWGADPLYQQAHEYWSQLSYHQFVENWNNPKISITGQPTASEAGLGLFSLAGAISLSNLGPGPDDLLALAVCVAAIGKQLQMEVQRAHFNFS